MSVQDKTIIVTGAGGGMGKAVVQLLLQDGANVIGCDINSNTLVEFESNERFLFMEGNLLDEQKVKDAFEKSVKQFGKIDGLVNAVGVAQSSTPIEEVSLKEWHHLMDINMTMIFLTCREAAIYMKQNQKGSIVNVGSVSTTRPRPGLQAYIASKGAVESFSKALALELAPENIRVNTLHPGPCDTNMLGQFAGKDADIDEMKDTVFKQSVPLGKLLTPNDIAQSAKFLLSDESSMVTGSVFHVDGGRSV